MLALAHRLYRTAACSLVLLLAGGPGTSTGIAVSEDPREGGGSGTPTIAIDQSVIVGAVGDPTNPTALVTLSDSDDPVEQLVVTVESTNGNVLPAENVTVQGNGEERIVLFEPVGRGTSSVTFTVVDPDENEAAVTMTYASSVLPPDPSGRYHHHISDASAALDVGDGLMLLVNDETNTFFLHRQAVSGLPVKTWTFTPGQLGTTSEIDFESMARSGALLVLSGSHGNNRSGAARPERRTFIGATITGTGADTELAFLGRYNGLWTDLRTWDAQDGHGLGADFLGFVAGTAPGVQPNPPNGFNIEALELAPDGEALYLGFRAPTIEIEGTFHALLVPVLNVDDIVDGVPAPGPAVFGDPILLDLGGRSIRAMRGNEQGDYLIIAGPSPQNGTWALYVWDGEPAHDAQLNQLLPNENPFTSGTWEGLPYVPHPLVPGAEVRVVADSGDTNFYGTGQTKDLPQAFQKSYSQLFVLEGSTHDLTVSIEGGGEGTVSGDGITCPGDCEETYPAGTEVTLSAAPEPGSVFTGWGGDCAGTDDCPLILDADKAVTATFVAAASLAFEPASLDFGEVEVGDTGPTLSATLSNTGELAATGLSFDTTDPAFAVATGTCGATLPSGESCEIGATFTPPEAGAATAMLAASSAEGASTELALAGSGVGGSAPEIDVNPERLSSVLQSGQTGSRVLTISNLGEEALDWEVTEEAGLSGKPVAGGSSTRFGASSRISSAEAAAVAAKRRLGTATDSAIGVGRGESGARSWTDPGLIFGDTDRTVSNDFLNVGSLTFYDDRGDFQVFNPGLSLEDFSDTNAPPNAVTQCPPPFNSDTDNACFSPGDIKPGLSMDVTDVGGGDAVVLTPPVAGVSCVSVGPSSFASHADWDFDPPVRAVGFDLQSGTAGQVFTVTVFGPGGALGSTEVTSGGLASPVFFGVDTADIQGIRRIEVRGPGAQSELFCNVEFGGQTDDCTLPDWVSVDPTGGTVDPSLEQVTEVTFDATGLAPGELTADLCIASNDPFDPLVTVPLRLTVEAATPVADITPGSFAFEVPQGGNADDALNIGNLGAAELMWEITTAVPAPALGAGGEPVDFPADPTSLGPIPDGPDEGCQVPGLPRDVLFNVAGLPAGAPADVQVAFTGAHTWVGDLLVILIAPDGTMFDIFGYTGATTTPDSGDSSDFAGPYTFSDGATSPPFGGWWQAATAAGSTTPIATGTYRTTQRGGPGTPDPAPATELTAAFAGLTDPNGTWTLRFTDGCDQDIGAVTAATLTLTRGPQTCDEATEVDWLSVSLESGATAPESSEAVSVLVDTSGLSEGSFEASLCVATNDPAAEVVPVPVTLTVTEAPPGEGFMPMALEVDEDEIVSDGNGVFEPGERVEVAPAWRNDNFVSEFLGGTASDLIGPEGPSYTIVTENADYGDVEPGEIASCREAEACYEMDIGPLGVERPALHWDAGFNETLSDSEETTWAWILHIGDSFTDVPRESLFYRAIETLLHSGVAGGCTATEYCPTGGNTRGQMAVFLLRAVEGGDYAPPACVEGEELFADVPFDSSFCPWIEELAGRQITSGCGGSSYCPGNPVTRAQMAVFLLRAFEGGSYTPPECAGEFSDVQCPSTFAAWIEELADREITSGCSANPPAYCPAAPVTRAQMAVFVTETFGLTLYGP